MPWLWPNGGPWSAFLLSHTRHGTRAWHTCIDTRHGTWRIEMHDTRHGTHALESPNALPRDTTKWTFSDGSVVQFGQEGGFYQGAFDITADDFLQTINVRQGSHLDAIQFLTARGRISSFYGDQTCFLVYLSAPFAM